MFLCAYLGFRINKNRDKEIVAQWETDKYSGIEPGDYDYVWFDFANTERALILKQEDTFRMYVQEYDCYKGTHSGCMFRNMIVIRKIGKVLA